MLSTVTTENHSSCRVQYALKFVNKVTAAASKKAVAIIQLDTIRLLISVTDAVRLSARRQLEPKKIHIFILQYSFIQLLLIYQKTIHMYSSLDRPHRIYANKQKRYIR